jgi:hypothetical protein
MSKTFGLCWALAGTAFLGPLRAGNARIACTVDNLAFLQGNWRYTNGASTGEERWILTAAGTLAGSSWEAKGPAISFVEASSIAPDSGRIELHLRHFDGALRHAWEEKDAPMIFVLAQCDGDSAVFDGTGARTGEHMTYRKESDGVTFIGNFLHQGKPIRVESKMHKSPG